MSARGAWKVRALWLALASASLAASVPACDGSGVDPSPSRPGAGSSDGAGGDAGEDAGPPPTPSHVWTECQASDQAWVRRAILAVTGRRPWGQAEVNAYEDVIAGIRKADLLAAGKDVDPSGALPPGGEDLVNARKLVMRALTNEDAFRQRWSDFFMDALKVVRVETKSQKDCYGTPLAEAFDDGALAAWVRDNDPSSTNPLQPGFTMDQLLSSSIALDDLSPVYRAHLFAMLSRPYTAGAVGPYEMERARRQNFGAIFHSAYIHRDLVCLSCHNSEFSVTYNEDPSLNRAWPVPGLFEVALYGSSNGLHPVEEQAEKGTDELRGLSMLRYWGVADAGDQAPYGWNGLSCGMFQQPQEDDPLGVDTYFGSIRSTPDAPNRGLRASVWDLERALHRGVDLLAAHGLQRLPGNKLADPDEAFAYLLAENVVEQVWAEVMGTRLTIATYFPRTQEQRDILMGLTEHFIASHFSLKTLLADVLAHPAFNLKAPEEGCGSGPYEVARILDPWTLSEMDLARRGNSPADGVFAISSRPLRRSLHRAMEWPFINEYPEGTDEEMFQTAIGFFLKDGEPGFRGLDFQGRLSWESMYGACSSWGANDFVAKVAQRVTQTPGATVGDAVIALKDRLIGEPWVEPTSEKPQMEALLGRSLADTDVTDLEGKLRSLCGELVSSPQFMMGGQPAKDTREVPKLSPPEVSYEATCGYVAGFLGNIGAPYTMTCGPGTVTVTRK
ncbi:hypothetical protein [Polyangium mundeleinium]|uniref:DUF1549 domain-containing protein n=1 Tax=Polyangium mundeleinium TaxID=2995306 RepID=A0ABT5F6I1_9BACT|nr:hypothetical protein [Polyangium mundeleinium]MDC0749720.1 hypothetical protein [Polyangium mundeleinium]